MTAALQALLVTLLWSSTFIVTKWIFEIGGVGPLWLNALRFAMAALVLLGWRTARRRPSWRAEFAGKGLLLPVIGLGVANFAIAQGGVTLGLHLLPSTHVSLILSLNNTLQVILFGALLLREWPSAIQSAGLLVGLGGAALFYWPVASPPGGWWGALPVIITGVAYGLVTIYTRKFMRAGAIGAMALTEVAMAAGAVTMAVVAYAVEGLPQLTAVTFGYLLLLAVVNTAFTFPLWAHTQKVLAPFETSTLNNTMLVQIALLAWLLLGESLGLQKVIAILVVTAGTLLVQVGPHLAGRWRS
ncbi:MAG: DMT family transporter [Bacillota bacterium]